MTGADRMLAAARREHADRTPIWFMRQAGRCLAGYRALREIYDILTITRTPELCAQVTLMPVAEFGVDAAVMYADIMLPLIGMGVPFSIDPGIGPLIHAPVRSADDIAALRIVDPREATPELIAAIRLVRKELEGATAVVGFAGGPFTVASYMIEGRPTKEFSRTKAMLYGEPALWHRLMSILTDVTIRYLEAQVEAGAQMIQLFELMGGRALSRRLRGIGPPVQPADPRGGVQDRGADDPLRDHDRTPPRGDGDAGSNVMSVDWRLPLDVAWRESATAPSRATSTPG